MTNWDDNRDPKKFKKLLFWKDESVTDESVNDHCPEGKPSYHRKLWMDDILMKRFLPRYCSDIQNCVLCRPVCAKNGKKQKCPNDNQVPRAGHIVFTPVETSKKRYKILYKTPKLDFSKRQNNSYPKFNSKKTTKVKTWMSHRPRPIIGEIVDNYIPVSATKFSHLPDEQSISEVFEKAKRKRDNRDLS